MCLLSSACEGLSQRPESPVVVCPDLSSGWARKTGLMSGCIYFTVIVNSFKHRQFT